MKKIIKNIALTIVFLLALHLSVRYLGQVLYPNIAVEGESEWSQDYASYYFSWAKRNSFDTVLIGSSHQFCGVDVNILNHEYGRNSILLSSSGQTFKLSYFAAREAIELQHPKTIVLEAYCAETEQENLSAKRYFLDDMPNWTRTKMEAVKATGDPPYLYYYPLTALHSLWPDLKLSAWKLPGKLPEGQQYRYYYTRVEEMEPWEEAPPERKAELKESSVFWLKKLAQTCRENGVELVLYVAPYYADEHEREVFLSLEDLAEELGIRYYNLLYSTEEIGLDPTQDYLDQGHLNCFGQEKLTRYLAEKGIL